MNFLGAVSAPDVAIDVDTVCVVPHSLAGALLQRLWAAKCPNCSEQKIGSRLTPQSPLESGPATADTG